MFAYFSILLVNFGDFSRFVKNENELKKGNASLIINLILFSIFAIFIVIGVGYNFKSESSKYGTFICKSN